MRTETAMIAALLLATSASAEEPARANQGRSGSILGTAGQIEKDTRAARIFASPAVQAAIEELVKTYEKDPVADMPDARKTLRRAAEANAMAQSLGVVAQDPDRPSAHWGTTSPHYWGDTFIPLAGTMVDNPDNIYRSIPIDGAASYEIRGRVIFEAPVQETFVLHNEKSGAKKNQKVRSQEREDGSVSLDTLPVARDGTFTITVDSSPAAGRLNHIQSNPKVRNAYILVRDTIPDWARQNPVELEVERVAGPPLRPAPTEEELARKAAQMTASVAAYFLTWAKERFYAGEPNTFAHQFDRASGWGFVKCGYYKLNDDEALIVRLDRREAAYLGFQLSDAWGQGQAPEYLENTGSLSGDQAKANADASYSYVISGKDPGAHNWLATDGLRSGTFCARWQQVPDGVTSKGAVKAMNVVKIADLKTALPAETVWLTPAQREAQLDQRAKDFARRLQY